MTIEEPANLPDEGGSDNFEPSTSIDDPANLDFAEPDDEQANPEDEAEGVDGEPDDAPTDEEGEETEGETEAEAETEEGEEPGAKKVKDDVLVTLNDGTQIPIEELKLGYLRERDYRHKTQELGNKRRDMEAMNERVKGTVEALTNWFAEHLPDEPDPALAYSNPNEYVQKKAAHDSAMAQIQKIIDVGSQAKETAKAMSDEQRREKLFSENAKLIERLPFLTDGAKRDDFNRKTFETATALGFTPDELNSTLDHRFLVLGHYARLGLEAEKARANAAKKVEKAPPVTPTAKRSTRKDAASQRSKEAMTRLKKTGSIYDAMKIDFD